MNTRKRSYFLTFNLIAALILVIAVGLAVLAPDALHFREGSTLDRLRESEHDHEEHEMADKQRTAIGRAEYEFNRLRSPVTGQVPADIHSREMAFVKRLPVQGTQAAKSSFAGVQYSQFWVSAGPDNVGGRTRALAYDMEYDGSTNRRILAGGVSGGMFLSEDDGASWTLTTSLDALASVTALAQDPSDHDVWYYGTGEWFGSSANGGGNQALWGHGVFKSVDGGRSWSQLEATVIDNRTDQFDSDFDIVWSLVVDDDGTVFAALRSGIYRSADGGDSWEMVLFGTDGSSEAVATDIIYTTGGALFAAMSRNGGTHPSGVFFSADGGDSWLDISPPMLASDTYRMKLAASESDPGTVYLIAQTNASGETASDHQLLRLSVATFSWTDLDLASRVPEDPDEGGFSSQGGYDLAIAVKPDNPETFWIGGTNLLRTTDGGQSFEVVGGLITSGEDAGDDYIGHFPDQHAIVFEPGNPNVMLSGNDGGIFRADDDLESPQTWTSLNNGYTTTQFYSIAVVPDISFDERLLGSMQDNGNHLRSAGGALDGWQYIEINGDGAVPAFADGGSPFYVSVQNGKVIRIDDLQNELVAWVQPAGFEDDEYLFVAPYVLDPNDTNVMYMAVANGILRNSDLSGIPNENEDPTDINWTGLGTSALENQVTTALAVTTIPADRLYFAGSDMESTTTAVRVDDPVGDGPGVDITPPGLVQGAYVYNIGVNPWNGDELIVAVSNYDTPSLFHSSDGGVTWTDIEGNLGGDGGPSLRDAEILPTLSSQIYFVSSSAGIYATTKLDGENTVWVQQASDVIGSAVVEDIAIRAQDGYIAAGSHGRGAYTAYVDRFGTSDDDEGTASEDEDTLPASVTLRQNYPNPFNPSTTVSYELSEPGTVMLQIFDIQGRVVDVLAEGSRSAGSHEVTWDGRSVSGDAVASGTYLYRLVVSGGNGGIHRSETRQMMLVK